MDVFRLTVVKYRTAAILVIFTCVLFVWPVSVQSEQSAVRYGACPAGWQTWKGSCYKNVLSNPRRCTWQVAKSRCQELGGHLATPNSQDEYKFIWDNAYVDSFGSSSPDIGVWIDCIDEDGEGVLELECIGDTSDVKYRAGWSSSGPGSDRNCVVMSTDRLKWNYWVCTGEKNVMCERPVPVYVTRSMTCSAVANDRCLLGHTFETLSVRGRLQCCQACHNDQRCRSFNLKGNQCELNDVSYDDNLTDGNCVHYEL